MMQPSLVKSLPLSLRVATKSDIPAIQKLAEKVWWAHYPSIISEAQITYMLELMYSEKSLRNQMEAEQHRFVLAEEEGMPLGFVSYARENAGSLKIHKLYVDQERKSRGIGSGLIREVIRREPLTREVRLTVNRRNVAAVNFYFREGFRIESCLDKEIGAGFVMNDFVMLRKIS